MHARRANRNIPVVKVICLYLARSEKDLGKTKLVIFVIHTKRVKQRLQKKNRANIITVKELGNCQGTESYNNWNFTNDLAKHSWIKSCKSRR